MMSQQLASRHAIAGTVRCLPARACARRSRTPMIARAEGRVVREYREGDDKIVSPAAKKPEGDALYAQDAKVPKQQGLSKEYKQKLREEYVGLGGAEGQEVGFGRSVALLVVDKPHELELAGAAPAAAGGKVAESKWQVDESEQLTSTWEHRAWTFGCMALLAAGMEVGLSKVDSPSEAATVAAALLSSYVLSDLGTGVYHWGVDNYGDGTTPFFGRQIAAFQGHHQRPWTITMREFCNNVHQVFKPATPVAAGLLGLSFVTPSWWGVWSTSFLFLVCMSQQFHALSHMKKSQLHPAIIALQDAGLLISRRAHGAHHRAPFEGNYCIVSGLWNPLLDGTQAFRALEAAVHAATGVEPRCWHEPLYEVEEEGAQGL